MVVVWLIFAFLFGACVGSFLNVVIFRLPEGRSVVAPGSHDPKTGRFLSWWENIPIVSWLILGGRDRVSREPISLQYPLVELLTAGLFVLLAWAYYVGGWRSDFAAAGASETWPTFLVHLTLIAALVAASAIDARLYIIPLQLTWFVALVGIGALPAATAFMPGNHAVSPAVDAPLDRAALGGLLGLAAALLLLRSGMLRRSFADEAEVMAKLEADQKITLPKAGDKVEHRDIPSAWLAYPHARREMVKELAFLALPTAGGALAAMLPAMWSDPPAPVAVLAGCVFGYLVGGAVVWFTRVLGTLLFGKEAMGLGDVHLVAGIGAVVGAKDAALLFFIAPFLALLAMCVIVGASALMRRSVRAIPYGPYLAAAALVVMLFREPIWAWLGI